MSQIHIFITRESYSRAGSAAKQRVWEVPGDSDHSNKSALGASDTDRKPVKLSQLRVQPASRTLQANVMCSLPADIFFFLLIET